MRPIAIPKDILKYIYGHTGQEEMKQIAREGYRRLNTGHPEVSIVIPAYNEAENIVATLCSLCSNRTGRPVEIIVVNNNSADNTGQLAEECGVHCVFQPIQGITVSRNLGLSVATGKYVLNADADSIYPEDWIEEMVRPLENNAISLTYGRFSLIPTGSTGRTTYFFYEYLTEFSRWLNSIIKDEAVNVYGFNSGFRKVQGLEVDSFNHPPGTNEDGWLAVKLRNKGYGKLHCVRKENAIVWTTDRRIQIDGGLFKGGFKRIKRTLLRR